MQDRVVIKAMAPWLLSEAPYALKDDPEFINELLFNNPYMDYNPLTGDPPVYGIATDAQSAQNSADHPLRHAFGAVSTPADGSGGTSGGTGGTGGGGGLPPDDTFE